jgi:hydrogenase nickel incorporation protein HypB
MSISMRIARIRPAEVRLAEENAAFLRAMGIVTIHLQASPGAGKTSLIQRTAESLSGRLRLAVIQGTLSNQSGVTHVHAVDLPVVQVNTGEQPYLDASMVREALEQLPLADVDLILIEEIGTLTLPTEQVLGATLRVAMASLPEGEDCPVHYPGPFARADAIVLNKTDLMAHLGFDQSVFHQAVRRVNGNAPIFELSCRSGEGIEPWSAWLLEQARDRQL